MSTEAKITLGRKRLAEAKDLALWELLVNKFREYVDSAPGTGAGSVLSALLEHGTKAMPSDERACEILQFVCSSPSAAFCVNTFLNMRLADLPLFLRPMYEDEGAQFLARWQRGEKFFEKVKDLVDFEKAGAGSWVMASGKKAKLLASLGATAVKESAGSEKREVQIGKEILAAAEKSRLQGLNGANMDTIIALAQELVKMHGGK